MAAQMKEIQTAVDLFADANRALGRAMLRDDGYAFALGAMRSMLAFAIMDQSPDMRQETIALLEKHAAKHAAEAAARNAKEIA